MEKKAGLELFFTDTPGIGGKLKKYPEDFIVEEEIDLFEESEGDYTIAKVWSRNWETNRLLKRLADELNISRKDIAFAGTKDKRAITVQWMSFKAPKAKLEEEININDVEIKETFTSHRTLRLGAHKRNTFEVLIRDMKVDEDEALDRADRTGDKIKEEGGFPNWFGVQRFGTIRPITHIVGKKLTKGDFKGALETYVAAPQEGENDECYEARKFFEETGDIEEALDIYPAMLTFERRILRRLKDDPDDYVSALNTLPHNLLMMFIHSYQSYLFNRMISMRLKRDLPLNDALLGDIILPTDKDGLPNKDTKVEVKERNLTKASSMVREGKAFVSAPLYGHKSAFSKGKQGEIERKIIEEEGVRKDEFIIPEMPAISSTGTRRSLFTPVKNFTWNLQGNALRIKFSLNKGSYATTLLREFMKHPPGKEDLYS